ncbi:MAG: hypothetical protein KAS32_30475, partial [Candidatus Peribacteraceae bacterium]|nr:hypothetical protein [Candidatus Peribacteraceae bacterium]
MITLKGWDSQFMLSLFKKEAVYDTAIAMSSANACSLKGFECDVEYDDSVIDDKSEVTGTEHGTEQELVEKGVKLTIKEPKAKPNTVAGLAALVMGNVVSTQDSTFTGYKHKITPVAVGTAIPAI